MGCNVSRLEVNGTTRLRPLFLQRLEAIKARTPFPCRRPFKDPTPSKKGLLSLDDEDMDPSVSSNPSNSMNMITPYSLKDIIINKPPKGTIQHCSETPKKGGVNIATVIGNNYGINVDTKEKSKVNGKNVTKDSAIMDAKTKKEDARVRDTNDDHDHGEDDDVDDDERMISYENGPGSPSFRIYFKENFEDSHNEFGKDDDPQLKTVSTGDFVPSKESSCVEKKVKRSGGRKKRCLRKVLPKRGQAAAMKNLLNVKSCCCYDSACRDQRHIIKGKPPI